MRILFSTTNTNKIERIERLLDEFDLEILTLPDIGVDIAEPDEVGGNVEEVAKNKALYYYNVLENQYPILTQDDSLDFLGNVEEEENPGLSIKGPVVKKYGEFSTDTAIKYYSELAKKYGGEIPFSFKYGHAYIDNNGIKHDKSFLHAKLVAEPKGIEKVGKYPLRALTQLKLNNQYVYSCDVSEKDRVKADSDLKRALVNVLGL